jgi:hypothetical protein
MCLDIPVKRKNKKNLEIQQGVKYPPHISQKFSIQFLAEKCKYKIDYFHFFMNIAFYGLKSQNQLI